MAKSLPTSAPRFIPPEFVDIFAKEGWQSCERKFGKKTVECWRLVLGRKVLDEARSAYLKEKRGG